MGSQPRAGAWHAAQHVARAVAAGRAGGEHCWRHRRGDSLPALSPELFAAFVVTGLHSEGYRTVGQFALVRRPARPAFVFLFGGLESVPLLAWVWLILLNGLFGFAFGCLFLRSGIGAAIIAHFSADLVWHV